MVTQKVVAWVFGCVSCALALGVWSAPAAEKAVRVTLEQRSENGAYGKCAYSFRHASGDLDDHGNEVDLIFDVCGSVHISDGGATNRVARAKGKKLADVVSLPEQGWHTSCFTPEKAGLYVMQIEDDDNKFAVKFRVVDNKRGKVTLEWLPLRLKPGSVHGTRGNCGGPHACK